MVSVAAEKEVYKNLFLKTKLTNSFKDDNNEIKDTSLTLALKAISREFIIYEIVVFL